MAITFEEVKERLCKEIEPNKSESKEPVIFLVGAGISYSSPTNLSLFPQNNCLKQLSFLKYYDRNQILEKIRPELFFQILLKHMGDGDGLLPLKVLDTTKARKDGFSVEPNVIHYLLAALIQQGNIVISTNFDGLIEDAYQNLYKEQLKKERCLITNSDFEGITRKITEKTATTSNQKSGYLIKLHGSFCDPDGNDTSASIVTLLSQHQSESVTPKIKLLEALHNHTWVVMGHSLRDEYDLYKVLSKPEFCPKKIYWIKHTSSEKGEDNIISDSAYFSYIVNKYTTPTALMEWKDVSYHNMYHTLHTCCNQNNAVYLIQTDTAEYAKHLFSHICPDKIKITDSITSATKTTSNTIDEYTEAIIKSWSEKLTPEIDKKVSAEILQYFDSDVTDIASWYLMRSLNNRVDSANAPYQDARLAYKLYQRKSDSKVMEWGVKQGITAIERSKSAGHTNQEAEAHLAVAQLYRLQGKDKIVKAYSHNLDSLKLQVSCDAMSPDQSLMFAASLRSMAHIIMTMLPDLPPIPDDNDYATNRKNMYAEILGLAKFLCKTSINIYQKIGNLTGERGLNQTYNLLGLLNLRLGSFEDAETYFKLHIADADASRFLRESQQGYRNLSLAQMQRLCSGIKDEDRECCAASCIENMQKSLQCLGIEYNSNQISLPGDKKTIEFNTIYNYFKCLVVCSKQDSSGVYQLNDTYQSVRNFFLEYSEETKLKEFVNKDTWDMQCRILTLLCCTEHDSKKAEEFKNKVVDIYTDNKKAVLTINFGIQNFLENLKLINNRFGATKDSYSYTDFGYKIKKMIPNLAIKPAKIVKDLSGITRKIEKCPTIP